MKSQCEGEKKIAGLENVYLEGSKPTSQSDKVKNFWTKW